MGHGGFEVFKINGDMHVVLDKEFFKVALIGGDGGMYGVFEYLLVESAMSMRTLIVDRRYR
jgi:hypothetical protein